MKAKSAAERENMQSVPDNNQILILNNETLNLIDDFILDHIDDFTHDELFWIMDALEGLSKSFYKKFREMIDQDIEDFADELEGDDVD